VQPLKLTPCADDRLPLSFAGMPFGRTGFAQGFILAVVITAVLSATLGAAPRSLDYPELRLKYLDLIGEELLVRGEFNYLMEDGETLQMRMGEGTVEVSYRGLAPDIKAAVRDLRNFSRTPLTVKGVLRQGGVAGNKILIEAEQLDIDATSTRLAVASRRGIVTVPEIRLNPFRMLNSQVTMEGRFNFREPARKVFRVWRGVDAIDVEYGQLSEALQKEVLMVPNFSDRPLKVTGVLRSTGRAEAAYQIEATALQIEEAPDQAQLMSLEATNKKADITYSDLLLNPERYIKQKVMLKGGYETRDPLRKVFEIWQGGDSIEVFYQNLPTSQIKLIESLPPFSSLVMVVNGQAENYHRAPRRFFIIAENVVFDKSD
jgi:hypothetical protein